MKQKWVLFVVGLMLVAFLKPSIGFAIKDGASLEAFIKAEGFESVEDFEEYYEYYFLDDLSNVSDIEELKEILGAKITNENVEELVASYGYGSKQELVDELMMYGDLEEGSTLEETFIYINALDIHLDYYQSIELTPITDENLQDLLEAYEISREELDAILEEIGESLENFEYIEDLEEVLIDYYFNEDMMDEFYDAIMAGFEEIGLTKQELERLLVHFMSVAEEDDTILDRLMALDERMMQLPDFDSADDMTEAQMNELVSIFNELLNITQIDAKYYLVKGNSKQSVTLNELIYMETTNGADLLIELYSHQGEFLADMIFTAENFASDVIKEEVNKITKPIVEAEQKKTKKPVKKVTKTENGGKLPNTAGNYAGGILLGTAIAGLGGGMLVYRKRKSA